MNRYKIEVTYSIVDSNGDIIMKKMPFLVPANSLEEARTNVQETALVYINKVNGALVSVE